MNKFNVDDLVEKKLVRKKTYTEGPYAGLSVLKYTSKVFFDNLWNTDSRLIHCRGMVVDQDDNIVSLPFDKVFNYKENNTLVDLDKHVTAVRKLNGFLGVATIYNDEVLVSTSGTLDSEYADLARKWIMKGDTEDMVRGYTYMFEICDKTDPHIVGEYEGAYLIGIRSNTLELSALLDENLLDEVANMLGCNRPNHNYIKFGDLLEELKTCKHEGYMVRDTNTKETLCKLKSPHYLSKKAMMRIGKAKIDMLFNDPDKFKERVDEEFYELVDHIYKNININVWKEFNEQERGTYIEGYFNE